MGLEFGQNETLEYTGSDPPSASSACSAGPRRQQRDHSGLPSIVSRSSFLSDKLLLGKLSETVVVVGNAPHDRAGFLMCHLIGNRASFLCTKTPMPRSPETNFLQGITSTAAAASIISHKFPLLNYVFLNN